MDEQNDEVKSGEFQAGEVKPEEVKTGEAKDAGMEAEEVKAEVVGAEDKAGPMAIVSLICGILSVLCHCVPIAGSFIGFILSVAAIVTGILELARIKKGQASPKGRGMSIAGIILGAAGIVFGIIWIVIISVASFTGVFGEFFRNWPNY
ncbi:MAG: DUF4190 domain-containing protein [Actinobacteria bacterium]|nr:DUF4190 domain-containing protein [Actinomycetota bacterium]